MVGQRASLPNIANEPASAQRLQRRGRGSLGSLRHTNHDLKGFGYETLSVFPSHSKSKEAARTDVMSATKSDFRTIPTKIQHMTLMKENKA